MARPYWHIDVHCHFFEVQAMKVKDAINCVLKKDSLNDGDIQAVKTLTEVYEELSKQGSRKDFLPYPNPSKETDAQRQADCSSDCHQVQQEK